MGASQAGTSQEPTMLVLSSMPGASLEHTFFVALPRFFGCAQPPASLARDLAGTSPTPKWLQQTTCGVVSKVTWGANDACYVMEITHSKHTHVHGALAPTGTKLRLPKDI